MLQSIAALPRASRNRRRSLAGALCVAVAVLGLSACEGEASSSTTSTTSVRQVTALPFGALSVENLKFMMDESEPFDLVDVRSVQEYSAAHLPGAVSIPFAQLAARYTELNPRTPTVVYCRLGQTCILACQLLSRLRFVNVYYLNAGIDEWQYAMETSDRILLI
jgi:rhodanese-related sulfurtransferase